MSGEDVSIAQKQPLGLMQRMLPEELLLEIFMAMNTVTVSRAACVCRQWRLQSQHQSMWRAACLKAWEYRETKRETEIMLRDRFHGDWRTMFNNRVRLRTDGIYVSRNTYIK